MSPPGEPLAQIPSQPCGIPDFDLALRHPTSNPRSTTGSESQLELDPLRQRQFRRPVNRVRLAPHVRLPRIAPRLAPAAGVLLAAESAVIVSTFGPEGPTTCSGLDVVRYDADSLHGEFGARFRSLESSKELHRTPFGTTQQFLYCYCRIE